MEKIKEQENVPVGDEFREMYLDCTDPLRIAEQRRKYKIKKLAEDKKKDTGL